MSYNRDKGSKSRFNNKYTELLNRRKGSYINKPINESEILSHYSKIYPEYLIVPFKHNDGSTRLMMFYEIPEKIEISCNFYDGSYGEYAPYSEFNGVENEKEIASGIKSAMDNLSEDVIISEKISGENSDITKLIKKLKLRYLTSRETEYLADDLIDKYIWYNLEELKDTKNQKEIDFNLNDLLGDPIEVKGIVDTAVKFCWDIAEETFNRDEGRVEFSVYDPYEGFDHY